MLFTGAFSIACNLAASLSNEVPKVVVQSEPTPTETTATQFAEPVTPIDSNKFTDGLRETWRRFTASGQYRLAQVSDMQFSDRAKKGVARNIPANPIPFVYIWGDLIGATTFRWLELSDLNSQRSFEKKELPAKPRNALEEIMCMLRTDENKTRNVALSVEASDEWTVSEVSVNIVKNL